MDAMRKKLFLEGKRSRSRCSTALFFFLEVVSFGWDLPCDLPFFDYAALQVYDHEELMHREAVDLRCLFDAGICQLSPAQK
jgi:hypothetical protein